MKIERFENIEAWQLARELDRRTRAAIRGFINYLKKYEERKAINCEPDNLSSYLKSAAEEILNDSEKKDIKRNASHRTSSPWQSAWRTC